MASDRSFPSDCELNRRDSLLSGVAEAARRLLSIADFDTAVNGALEAIALSSGIDRIFIYQNHIDPATQREFATCPYEWTVPGIVKSRELPGQLPMFFDQITGFKDWLAELKAGRAVQKLARNMSAAGQKKQEKEQALSVLTVPIFIQGSYWGNIGFDDCTSERIWSEAEIAVLETAAASFSGALQRRASLAELERTNQQLQKRDALLIQVNAAVQAHAAELEAHNRALEERDRILEATAAVSTVLLTNEDFDTAVNQALKIMGEAVGTDRVGIAEHLEDLTETAPGHWRVIYEWHGPEMIPVAQIHHPKPMQGTYEGAEQLYVLHQRGEGFSLMTNQMAEPFRSNMAFVGVQTLHAVPIILYGHYWGTVVFGDCSQQRLRSPAELTALKTVADCIGSAIQRDLNYQAREVAERTALIERERAARADELETANQILLTRDRWLETTAAAANELLSTLDVDTSVQAALATIGENLECDRVFVMQRMTTPNAPIGDLGLARLIYEWDADGMDSRIDNPHLHDILGNSFRDSAQQLLSGQWLGGIVDELEEPLRSRQQLLGMKSFYTVPVLVKGDVWGIVGIDYCREAKRLNSAELAVFKTAATCIGSAIYQADMRRDRAAQERAKLLSSVAEAANLLLRSTDYTQVLPDVVQLLGEAVECDRCGIGQDVVHPISGKPAVDVKPEWEWRTPSTFPAASFSPHGDHLYSWDDGPYLTEQMRKGVVASYLVADLPERDRTLMARQGTTATLFVPITLEHKLWGFIHFDSNHRDPRLYGEAEISILKVAAESIAAAIFRQTQDEALRKAEQTMLEVQEKAARVRAAELETYNQQLQRRDSLLNSVNAATQCLVANEDLSTALPALLKILGEGTQQCRAYILQNSRDPQTNERLFNLTLEWDAPSIPTKLEAGGRFPVPIHTFPDRLTAPLKAGRATQFLARELDGLDQRDQGQALSLVGVPITVGGEWWGLLGLDDCINERIWSEAEIAVLETAATAIGSALERDLNRKAREAAERDALITRERAARAAELEATNLILSARERWLNATAAAANDLLSTANVDVSVKTALQTIGKNLGCDRIGIMKHLPASTGLGNFHILHEWDSPGTRPQKVDTDSNEMSASEFEEWSKQLMSGHWVGGVVAELDDPFRSTMVALDTLSTYAVPIFVEAEFWGLMFIDHCQEIRQLAPAELAVFSTAATCIGSAIYREQMRVEREQTERDILLQQEREQAAQQRVAKLAKTNEAIRQTLNALTAKPELDDFLGRLLKEMVQQIGACKAHLFLFEEKSNTLSQHIAVQGSQIYQGTAPTDPVMFRTPFSVDISGAWQAIINSPKPLTLDERNPENAKLYWPDSLSWHASEGHRSSTCACMKVGQQPIGFIGFAFRHLTSLTDEQLEFIQTLTNQATLAIQLTRLAEQSQTTALLDERNRLAREIHDTLAQAFTGVSLQLEAAKGILNQQPDKAQTYINQAGKLARQGLSEARRSVRALRSQALETDVLSDALQKTLIEMTQGTSLHPQFQLQGSSVAIPDDLQLNLLRIGQEAITNVLRHAQAKTLILTLTFLPQQICLRIVDDGIGFNSHALEDISGFGLIGIRERASRFDGMVQINSTPQHGTAITVTLPL